METVLWFVRMLCVDALTFAFVVRVVLSIFSAPGALSFVVVVVVVVVVFPVLFTSSSSSSSIATFGFLEVFLSLFCKVVVPSSVSLGGGCILSVVCVVVYVVSLLGHSLFSLRHQHHHHHHHLYPSSSASSFASSTPACVVCSLLNSFPKSVYKVKVVVVVVGFWRFYFLVFCRKIMSKKEREKNFLSSLLNDDSTTRLVDNSKRQDSRRRFRRQKKRRRRRRRRRMPLANKEVVHLKHGWEKIQVGTTRFSFFRVLERATLRTHHHHHHFLNRISKKKRCFVFFPRAN